jgi:hypothetical protein
MKRKATSMYKGLPLVDANPGEKLEIEITESDINRSRKNDPNNCAGATAIKRILGVEAEVHLSRVYIKSKDKKSWIRFQTPESISREIVAFDRAHKFEPGVYQLIPVAKSNRLGMYKGKSTKTGKDEKRAKYHTTVNVRESARKSK